MNCIPENESLREKLKLLEQKYGYENILKEFINLARQVKDTTGNNIEDITEPKLNTEDTGKIFEMALCLIFETPYDGKYKYGIESAQLIADRLTKNGIMKHLPCKYKHTAKGGGTYDFTPVITKNSGGNSNFMSLSCKSNKTYQKVAPHSIGQARPNTFCERIGIPYTNIHALKVQMQNMDFMTNTLLPKLEKNTFDALVIYYHKKDNTISLIKQIKPIDWIDKNYVWTRSADNWNNSSTMKIDKTSILEVQFHEKNRKNMAVRWCFKNLLNKFPNCFEIKKF